MKRRFLLPLLFLPLHTTLFAEQTAQPSVEDLISKIDSLNSRLTLVETQRNEEQTALKSGNKYAPQLFGSTMVYYNLNTDIGTHRFALRNAHLGVRGKASDRVSYKTQINFHNLSSVSVLDAFVQYDSKRLTLTLGQQWIHLTADFDRSGPATNLFTSRSYGALYAASYSSSTAVKSLGNRDIGVYGSYVIYEKIPIKLSLGVFNGEGANNIVWDEYDGMNYTGRIEIGGKSGLSAGASVYIGNTILSQEIDIYSVEMRYVTSKLFVEANYQQRDLTAENAATQSARTYLLQSYYKLTTPKSRLFDHLAPSLRFDYASDISYLNLVTEQTELLSAGRLSALVHFMFKGAKIRSRLTAGYEKVFLKESPSDIDQNPLFQDRLTLAATIAF